MGEQKNSYKETEAAQYAGVSPATLRLWRAQAKGPRFYRAGERLIRYRKSDLDEWIESRLCAPTPETERHQ
jgi:excisionase family DNA binding protein